MNLHQTTPWFAKASYHALKALFFGVKLPMALSVDATYKCNLECKHCYFRPQDHQKELNETDFLVKIKETKAKYPSIIQASWVGGEPLLRKSLIEKGKE